MQMFRKPCMRRAPLVAWRLFIAAFVFFSFAAGALALSPEEQDFLNDIHREKFGGWKTIAIACSAEGEQDTRICNWLVQKARVLGASINVKTIRVSDDVRKRSYDLVTQAGKDGRPLLLLIEIQSTGSVPKATAVRISAQTHDDWAAPTAKDGDPHKTPRPGDLYLWERQLLAQGAGDGDFERSVGSSAETFLSELFADFSQGRQAR